MKQAAAYIMANRRNGTLYVGVTSNLAQRAWLHRKGAIAGFTKRYGCKILVWYEPYSTMLDAIAREKQIKGGSRKKKLALIEATNPMWAIYMRVWHDRHCERSEANQSRWLRIWIASSRSLSSGRPLRPVPLVPRNDGATSGSLL
jgi:predicted GIY-YIG superfamily endonuclease